MSFKNRNGGLGDHKGLVTLIGLSEPSFWAKNESKTTEWEPFNVQSPWAWVSFQTNCTPLPSLILLWLWICLPAIQFVSGCHFLSASHTAQNCTHTRSRSICPSYLCFFLILSVFIDTCHIWMRRNRSSLPLSASCLLSIFIIFPAPFLPFSLHRRSLDFFSSGYTS